MEPNEVININTPIASSTPGVTLHSEKDAYIAKHKGHLQPIRTFSSDLAQAVREGGGSVVRIAIAEDEKHKKEFQEVSITSRKNTLFTILGVFLVLGAITAVIWTYIYKKNSEIQLPVKPNVPQSLILSENSQSIDATGASVGTLVSAVNAIVASPNIQSGTIKNIITNSAGVQISASQFLTAIGATHAPSEFLRSLSPEYMLGVYLYKTSNTFLIVKGTAHDFLLAGILAWEPYMLQDLAPLFAINTKGITESFALNAKWVDTVVENHDARAVLDTNKKPILFYTFIDENTLFFGKDPKTLTTVISRIR